MKKITMFVMASCPHCKRANKIIEELRQEKEEYQGIEFEVVDEVLNPEVANEYDYYYVPSFFIGTKKLFEGVPTSEKIEEVLNAAL